MLQRSGVEHIVHAVERRRDAVVVADVADVELQLRTRVTEPHVFLLLLVTAEDTDLGDVGIEKPVENGVAERAGSAGDQKRLASKHRVGSRTYCAATGESLATAHTGSRRTPSRRSCRARMEGRTRSAPGNARSRASDPSGLFRRGRYPPSTPYASRSSPSRSVLADRFGRHLHRAAERRVFEEDGPDDPRHHPGGEPRINRTSIPLDDTPSLRQKPLHQPAGRLQLTADHRTSDRQCSRSRGLPQELRTAVEIERIRRIVFACTPPCAR